MSRTDANERLKDGSPGGGSGVRSGRLTGILITSEIALTLILLVAAGLMIRSLVKFQTLDTDPELLVGSLALTPPKYPEPGSRVRYLDDLLQRLKAVPGTSVTAATRTPGDFSFQEIRIDGTDARPAEIATAAVMPGYFEVMRAHILKGRDFDFRDGLQGPPVAVVNSQFVSRFWPADHPIGKRIQKGTGAGALWLTVVGVTSNLQVEDSETPQAAVYTSFRQEPSVATLIVRSRLPWEAVVGRLRAENQKADPDLPLFNVMTMMEYQAQLGVPLRLFVWLFSAFGALALLMSMIGIYGVTSFSVTQRVREMGVRMTLGASAGSILWLVIRQRLIQLGIALVVGFLGALAISHALAGMLFHTAPTDALTYAVIIVLFTATTIAACVIPSLRAIKVDPALSLRLQ